MTLIIRFFAVVVRRALCSAHFSPYDRMRMWCRCAVCGKTPKRIYTNRDAFPFETDTIDETAECERACTRSSVCRCRVTHSSRSFIHRLICSIHILMPRQLNVFFTIGARTLYMRMAESAVLNSRIHYARACALYVSLPERDILFHSNSFRFYLLNLLFRDSQNKMHSLRVEKHI